MNRVLHLFIMLFDHVGGLSRWDKNSRVLLLMNRLQVRDPINESKLYFVKIILVTFFFFLLIFLYLVTSKDELGSAIGIIIFRSKH
jgi:hypothetical protein